MNPSVGRPFEAGQPVVLGAGPGHARRWYRTSVHRVDAQTVWLHGAPFDQPLVAVAPGEDVTCHTWRHMDAAYQVQAKVAYAQVEPERLLGLKVAGAERIQQRAYVRVPLSTEAWALVLSSGSEGDRTILLDEEVDHPVRLDIRDLSAGGLRGRSNKPLTPGDELEIELPLPRADKEKVAPVRLNGKIVVRPDLPESLNLRARVVRRIETGLSESLACEIGVAFLDVPREAQERIIRFALEVQLDRRRRGML